MGATTEANVSLFVYPKGIVSSVNVNGKIVIKSPIKYIFTPEENSNIISKITTQSSGFIISKKELEAFLVYTAGRLNLSEAEAGELTKETRTAAEQVETDFVSLRYIDQKSLDSIHPLSINPKPQNISRIFFYVNFAQKNDLLTPPVLTPVARNGFTVIEIGILANL